MAFAQETPSGGVERIRQPFAAPTVSAPAAPTAAAPTVAKPSFYDTDPGYQQALLNQQTGNADLDSALRQLQQRAIIDYGDPSLAAASGISLDPNTAAFAQQNTLAGNSQLARLNKARDLQKQAVINRLAAHGLVNSGDLGYQTQNVESLYGNNLYDAQKAVLDYLAGQAQNTLQQKNDLRAQVVNALQNAYNTYVQNPALQPDPSPASYPNPLGPDAAPAAGGKNPTIETAAQRALRIRSQFLNRMYGLG